MARRSESIIRPSTRAERRHWELFYHLAGRHVDKEVLAERFLGWREFEAGLARGLGVSPAVHG